MNQRRQMLLLTEGDANTWASWSGCSHGLLRALRRCACEVQAADVSLRGLAACCSKVACVCWNRQRWAARHHYGPLSFRWRSEKAAKAVLCVPPSTPVLQTGATFCSATEPNSAFYVYADANALFGRDVGKKRSAALTNAEFSQMVERERGVYENTSTIFTMSECLRRSFINDFGIPPERVVTVHAGMNQNHVPSENELGGPKNPYPTILFVGKEFERKGGRILVEAFERVRRAIPDARLVIVGTSPDVKNAAGVDVRGFVSREQTGEGSLTSHYRSADLFCMPSLYEPFGVVFVEAMMHQLPCIGTTEWAMPEIIDEGRTGWLVPPDNPDALAQRLIEALRDRERLRSMGVAARQAASARFTWDRVAKIMMKRMFSMSKRSAFDERRSGC